jgi:hypothetical protein
LLEALSIDVAGKIACLDCGGSGVFAEAGRGATFAFRAGATGECWYRSRER